MKIAAIFAFAALAAVAVADLDVHCLEEEILGTWTLVEGEGGQSPDVNCLEEDVSPTKTWSLTLNADGTLSADDQEGTWTMTYDESISAEFDGRRWFISFLYKKKEGSICTDTTNGWVRGAEELPTEWACFHMTKDGGASVGSNTLLKSIMGSAPRDTGAALPIDTPIDQQALVDAIHASGTTWTAAVYPEEQMAAIAASLSRNVAPVSRANAEAVHATTDKLQGPFNAPEEFSWRDVDGTDYTGVIRDQGSCGSCWIFAAMGSLEDRIRIASDMEKDYDLSKSEILDCDLYGQGCDGGLPYLAGAYIKDHGIMLESDYPYKARDRKCKADDSKKVGTVSDYNYVGGRYGACSHDAMVEDLIENGPQAVAFYVYRDFLNYRGGVYQHTGVEQMFGLEWMEVNHGVRLVGYGTTEDGVPFWDVANSWGKSWGENGYFRIIRGTNNCAIEFQAVSMIPNF